MPKVAMLAHSNSQSALLQNLTQYCTMLYFLYTRRLLYLQFLLALGRKHMTEST